MKHWITIRGLISAFLGMVCLVPSMTYAKDSAIVIFDGSGSMWGQVDGRPKIEIAREVMSTLVQEWNEDIDLGLMVYGHREKGSCEDIELVVPVGTPDGGEILTAIKGINPKGKTPISAALKQAADDLRFTEDPATVILISDGEESCGADPCATAKEIEAKGIRFTAHVIGFDIKENPQAQAQLKCVAESTGGKFFEAQNAKGLQQALAETAKAVAEPVPPPEPEPAGETGVKLSAVPAEGAAPFSNMHDVKYRVLEDKKDPAGKRKQIGDSVYVDPVFQLAPARYVVVAERGNIRMEATIEVKAGELTAYTFVLNAGNLKLSAVPAEGAAPFSNVHDVRYRVLEDKKDLEGKRKKVGDSVHVDPLFRLAAGRYVVAAERGNIRMEAAIEVKVGELTEYTFVLNAGNLKLSAVPAEGAAPFSNVHDVRYRVLEDKKNLEDKRKKVGDSVYVDPVFRLAAGRYVVVATRGNVRQEATVEVIAGELVEYTLVLPEETIAPGAGQPTP
jgi:Ca-activated chloride channel family protein